MTDMTSREMPKYKSHKTVHALQIAKITHGNVIHPVDEGYAAFEVDDAYMTKHDPQKGGYYVVYDDGYKSFSPASSFEAGYTLI